MPKFLRGKDYPHLCSICRHAIDDMVGVMEFMPDTDDPEAPCMEVYDRGMYCGGHECVNKAGDADQSLNRTP